MRNGRQPDSSLRTPDPRALRALWDQGGSVGTATSCRHTPRLCPTPAPPGVPTSAHRINAEPSQLITAEVLARVGEVSP